MPTVSSLADRFATCLLYTSYHPLDASRAPRFALYRLRQRWSATLRRWLPRQLDGIEAAMLLADKSCLDDSVQQAFRTAGVSHLLAVSGLHLACLLYTSERAHLRNLPLAARAGENKHRGQRQQARQHDLPDLRKNVSHKKHSSLR